MLVAHLARPDGLGFGDVKYTALLGAGIGLVVAPLVLPAYLLAAVRHAIACAIAHGPAADSCRSGRPSPVASIIVVIAGLVGSPDEMRRLDRPAAFTAVSLAAVVGFVLAAR